SVRRLYSPVAISFNGAIAVAFLGFFVNIASALILKDRHEGHHQGHEHADHNLRAAYLHVLADALTSVLAIIALSAGRFIGWVWMDPLMGIVGAVVISRWSYQLMRDTGRILLDVNTNQTLSDNIRRSIESDGDNRISDLHVWRVGPGHFAAIMSVVTLDPRPPTHYKALIRHLKELCHVTVEINPYRSGPGS
ncbi:MAG: cation diffusion facilitator family transporter, partial [Desulfatiglandales bacterium]